MIEWMTNHALRGSGFRRRMCWRMSWNLNVSSLVVVRGHLGPSPDIILLLLTKSVRSISLGLPFRQHVRPTPRCVQYRCSEDPFVIIPHWIARSGEEIAGLSQALLQWCVTQPEIVKWRIWWRTFHWWLYGKCRTHSKIKGKVWRLFHRKAFSV